MELLLHCCHIRGNHAVLSAVTCRVCLFATESAVAACTDGIGQDGIQHFTADVAPPAPTANGHAAFALSLPTQQPPYFGGGATAGGVGGGRLGPHAAAQQAGLPSLGDLHAASLQIPKAAGGLAQGTMPNARLYSGTSLANGLHTGTGGLQGHLQGSAAGFSGQQPLQAANLLGSGGAAVLPQPVALQFGASGGAASASGGLGGVYGSSSLVAGSHGGGLAAASFGHNVGHTGSGGLSLAGSGGSMGLSSAAFSGAGAVAASGLTQNALLAEHTEAVLADAHQAYRRGQFHEALSLCQAVSWLPDQ